MNLNSYKYLRLCFLPAITMLAVGFSFAAPVTAQIRIEMPEIPEFRGEILDMRALMDGAVFSSGSNMSLSTSIENGVKKIRATENGVKTYIEEDESGIVVKITRRYGPEQMDILMEEHPGLYMAMKDFPTEVEDAEEIEVSLGVTKKYEAANAEELKEKHPEVFKSYQKYNSGNSGSIRTWRGGIGRGGIGIPEIRITPELELRRGGIVIPDIRIQEEEDSNESKKSDKKSEDKDT